MVGAALRECMGFGVDILPEYQVGISRENMSMQVN